MNEPIEAKKPPEVKPWVRRAVEAAGVFMPANADGARRLGWWGVEMARFLKFCKTLPEGTDLRSAMEGYGRYIKSSVPPPQDWQLDQAREALRCFQKGTENWHIAAPDAEGRVEVGFRVKTRTAEQQVPSSEFQVSGSPKQFDLSTDGWLEKSAQTMKVRRFALRTVETYLGWQRRFLNWVAEKELEPASKAGVEGFITWLAVERKVSAGTQNHGPRANRAPPTQHKAHKGTSVLEPGLFNYRGICWLAQARSNAPFNVRLC